MTVETATATIIDNHNAEPDMQTLVKKPTKKQIRQAVGAIVIMDSKVLMLSSRKKEGAYRLPRGSCKKDEKPEEAILRVLREEAGIEAEKIKQRVGTYTEANKKGKTVAHHWLYEVTDVKVLESWPAEDRKRVWFTIEESIAASADRHISRLALHSCSLSSS